MTLSVNLHNTNRTEISSHTTGKGYTGLEFIADCPHTGISEGVIVWLPRPIAEEIHRAMKHHFTPAAPAEASQ